MDSLRLNIGFAVSERIVCGEEDGPLKWFRRAGAGGGAGHVCFCLRMARCVRISVDGEMYKRAESDMKIEFFTIICQDEDGHHELRMRRVALEPCVPIVVLRLSSEWH